MVSWCMKIQRKPEVRQKQNMHISRKFPGKKWSSIGIICLEKSSRGAETLIKANLRIYKMAA